MTEASLDIEANINGMEISSIPGLDPAQYAGKQFQTSKVALRGGSTTTPAQFTLGNDPNNYYQVIVSGPGGAGITTGVYTVPGTSYYPLSFFVEDSGCNPGAEWLDVLEATYTANQLTSFAAMFEYHCDSLQSPGAPTPAVFGDISFNATQPFYAADLSTDVLQAASTGVTPSSVSATITNTGLTTLHPHGFSIGGTDPEDFTIGANSCDSAVAPGNSCSIMIEYVPPTGDASNDAVLQFYDELTPTLTPGGYDGLGSGRHILLYGTSTERSCLFNGNDDSTPVPDVTPGSVISLTCSGFLPSETVLVGEGSPLFLTSASGSDLDLADVQSFTASPSGALTAGFVVPNPFTASDPNAVCPPSAAQVDTGDPPCFITAVDSSGNGDLDFLDYASPPPPPATTPSGSASGYWMIGSDGGVFAFGEAPYLGSLPGIHVHVSNIRAVVPTHDGHGYWMVGSDGGVFAFGDAPYLGSLPGIHVHVNNIVGVVPTPGGGGYWMIGSDGGVFAFGDAPYLGSLPGIHVHANNIVGVVPTADGGGYWMIGSDGGVFAFGDASYLGSLPGMHVHVNNIRAVVPTHDGRGYWMIGSDGGVFAFGDAPYLGSLPGMHVNVNNIVGVVPTADGGGYWMIGSDGGVFAFGDAPYRGSLPGIHVNVNNIVGVVPT